MNPASELGKLSWKKRRKGKTKKEISDYFTELSKKAAAKRSLDKAKRSMPNQ